MKKNYLLILSALLGFALNACSSDNNDGEGNGNGGSGSEDQKQEEGINGVYLGFNGDNGKKLYWATANLVLKKDGTGYIPDDPCYMIKLDKDFHYNIYYIPSEATERFWFGWGDVSGKFDDLDMAHYGGEEPLASICGNPDYDIARAKLGGTWRLPSHTEFLELCENCTFEWIDSTNIYACGVKFTSKINGKSIFLPARSARGNNDTRDEVIAINAIGYYWAGTSRKYSGVYYGYCLHFEGGKRSVDDGYDRRVGRSVRPVFE